MKNPLADLFQKLTHGVYVIGVNHDRQYNAFTAAWVMQVSFQPLLLALSINPQHRSYCLLKSSRIFSVNVLKSDQLTLTKRFGRPTSEDKLATIAWHEKTTGAPILDEGLAYFDCTLHQDYLAGDHRLVIGKVVDGAIIDPDATPLDYRATGTLDNSSGLYPKIF